MGWFEDWFGIGDQHAQVAPVASASSAPDPPSALEHASEDPAESGILGRHDREPKTGAVEESPDRFYNAKARSEGRRSPGITSCS